MLLKLIYIKYKVYLNKERIIKLKQVAYLVNNLEKTYILTI
jgi:hypothetical protein